MKPGIERRLRLLEQASIPGRAPPCFFVLRPGQEPQGFRAAGLSVLRAPGESVHALQARCLALSPQAFAWLPC